MSGQCQGKAKNRYNTDKSCHSHSLSPNNERAYAVHSFKSLKGMEHVPNIFMLFNKYLFLEVINILI